MELMVCGTGWTHAFAARRLVSEQAFGRLHTADQALRERTIMRFDSDQ
jgi:hypothetical protein